MENKKELSTFESLFFMVKIIVWCKVKRKYHITMQNYYHWRFMKSRKDFIGDTKFLSLSIRHHLKSVTPHKILQEIKKHWKEGYKK